MNCKICDEKVNIKFIQFGKKDGTNWLGTTKPKGHSKLFRSSEYDFGFDYYAAQDLRQLSCPECGYVEYTSAS